MSSPLRSRAKEAERTREGACLRRFGTRRPSAKIPVVRSDNGVLFRSRRFRAARRADRLAQEFITPYTSEQNGMIEGFVKGRKEECTWLHNFRYFQAARTTIRRWIDDSNAPRPHQALNHPFPARFRAQRQVRVACKQGSTTRLQSV